MKMDYTAEDIGRAMLWYIEHKDHVGRLVKMSGGEDHPMTGSDISRPELWKPGGWNYFFRKYYLGPPSFEEHPKFSRRTPKMYFAYRLILIYGTTAVILAFLVIHFDAIAAFIGVVLAFLVSHLRF